MAYLSGKQAFLEILKQEGVEFLFGNPGTTELPLMDGLAGQSAIRYVLALQEGVAVAMADGYAQASGKPAVVNLHVAPGLGNGMGMLYDAAKAGAPLLVTAGQHDQSFNATEPILWGDLPTIAKPLVKWSSEVRRIEDLPRLVHRAIKVATTPPTGPVFLALPVDVLNREADLDLGEPTRVDPRIRGPREAIAAAVDLLVRAKRPMIFAGDAVAAGDAYAEMIEVAELLGAPVYPEAVPSRYGLPASHPLYQAPLPRNQAMIRAALEKTDLLFSVGGDLFTLSLPSEVEPMPPGLAVVHLDVDAWEIGKNYPAKVAILGDPKATLPDLAEGLKARLSPAQREEARRRLAGAGEAQERARAEARAKAAGEMDRVPIAPIAFTQAIAEALPKQGVVVDESITSTVGLHTFLACEDPQGFFGIRGGGIGWGLPAAIGVKLALPDRPVVGLIGDGSAMYTNQAFWTAAHYQVPVIFVICNNGSYRILKQRTFALKGFAAQTDTYIGMDLDRPRIDWIGLAQSLGVPGQRVEKASEIGPALRRALARGGPALIDVPLDPTFKPER